VQPVGRDEEKPTKPRCPGKYRVGCNDHILNYDQIQEYYNTRTDENINFEGVPQEDETCINLNDEGEYEKIYVVKNKCVLSDYKKSCINSMIGGFKPNTQKKVNWRSVHVTESKIEALQYSLQYEGSFMSSFVSNNKLFFHVFAPSKTTNIETIETHYPIRLYNRKPWNYIGLKHL
jgi:hypothetical protein